MSAKTGDMPAFPHPDQGNIGLDYHGMTLRDYFAAKVCSNINEYVAGVYYNLQHGYDEAATGQAELIARTAYEIADAMLAERAK